MISFSTWDEAVLNSACALSCFLDRCGNVAAILELDENLNKNFGIFEAAPQVCWVCIARCHSVPLR